MVSKDKEGKSAMVPRLILSSLKEVERFQNCVKQIAMKKDKDYQRSSGIFGSIESILNSKLYNVKVELQ